MMEDQSVAEGSDESARRSVRPQQGESIECPTLSEKPRKDGPPARQQSDFGHWLSFIASALVE
jgi:hypothetical protein